MADAYQVHLSMKGGPFTIDDSEPTVIRKSELKPAEKKDEEKADGKEP